MGSEYFLERRELGLINIGGQGTVTIDGAGYELGTRDGLYIGMGAKDIAFTSMDGNNPAKFYFNSAPAHQSYPTKRITLASVIDNYHFTILIEGRNMAEKLHQRETSCNSTTDDHN